MSLGIDCASHAPSTDSLKAAKVQFVCRYLAPLGHSFNWKRTDRAEAERIRRAGIDFVTVFESSAGRVKGGRNAGVEDARTAESQAKACGMPTGAPIYFAIDYDEPEKDQPKVNGYFVGVGSVLGKSRVGAYGGYWPLKRLFDAGLINYGWQTTAWSGGQWDPRAHIRQQGSGKVGGVSVDWDHSMKPDFGQWRTTRPLPLPPSLPDRAKRENLFRFWNAFKGKWWGA